MVLEPVWSVSISVFTMVGFDHIGNVMIVVDGGERAVIFDRFRGVLPKTVAEGTHFRIPLIQVGNRWFGEVYSTLIFMIFVPLLVRFLQRLVQRICRQWAFLFEC